MERTDFEYVSNLVQTRSAIVLEADKVYLIESRLLPVAHREGLGSVGELVSRLRSTSPNGLHQRVVEAMTTNETSFFRDTHPFDVLKKHVLVDMFARRATEKRLSIWCGASSTGQEPYTIALILREHFPQHLDWKIDILATDLSTDVLARAREGRYSQLEVNRGLPAPLLVKHFERHGTEWRVNDDIRRFVEFRQLNLISPIWRIGAADIVFLRNVLIYFDVPTKRAILQKVRGVMRRDGYLFLGGAETTLNIDDEFVRQSFDRVGCYRLKQATQSGAQPGATR